MSDTPITDAFTADDTQFGSKVGDRERAAFALMRTLERERDSARALLRIAKCPNMRNGCDNFGTIIYQAQEDEWKAEQCQWCSDRARETA